MGIFRKRYTKEEKIEINKVCIEQLKDLNKNPLYLSGLILFAISSLYLFFRANIEFNEIDAHLIKLIIVKLFAAIFASFIVLLIFKYTSLKNKKINIAPMIYWFIFFSLAMSFVQFSHKINWEYIIYAVMLIAIFGFVVDGIKMHLCGKIFELTRNKKN